MIDPQLNVLSTQTFPELAAALKTRCGTIVERWEEASREVLPMADELTLTQLRDHVPMVIDELSEALASDRPDAAEKMDAAYKEHGEQRFKQRYNVDELMAEYEVLRRIVVEEAVIELGRGFVPDESLALHAGIDRAVRRSVGSFVDHLSKQLKATDDLQSHYISFLNHDLRGGMNGILLMVEVLKRELSPEPRFSETIDDLDSMRRAVLDSVSTMDRFVFAHRLSRGKHQAKFHRFPVKPIINDLVSHLSYSARERGVEFIVTAGDEVVVGSDRELLRLIIQNLLLNTTKHAKRTGGKVHVVAKQQGTGIVISVADEGPGIAKEQMEALFTLSLDDPSHGKKAVKLGMPVAKQAADLIGATIHVESSPETGTTFTVTVPERHG